MTVNKKLRKWLMLALMIALYVILSPLFRIEGMAPMSSVMNILGAALMGPIYGVTMAFICGLLRIFLMGIPPLAITGSVFGALLAGIFYEFGWKIYGGILGEMIGTGVIGSLLSYPVMVWFTGSSQGMYWLFYTPRFLGGAFIGSVIAYGVYQKISPLRKFKEIQDEFRGVIISGKDESHKRGTS